MEEELGKWPGDKWSCGVEEKEEERREGDK